MRQIAMRIFHVCFMDARGKVVIFKELPGYYDDIRSMSVVLGLQDFLRGSIR